MENSIVFLYTKNKLTEELEKQSYLQLQQKNLNLWINFKNNQMKPWVSLV